MPVTYVYIEWPDGETDQVYSPSSVVEEYFSPGGSMEIKAFAETCSESLAKASERVRQKFGYACTSAQAEQHRISERCKTFDKSSSVKIIAVK